MPPYRRTFATLCILAPLVYVYWQKFATLHTLERILDDVTHEDEVFGTTLGFSKIFVINLPSRTDRRDAMSLAGEVSNLSFSWIDGVVAEEPSHDTTEDGKGGRGHSAGALGSWRSHMNALQAFIDDETLESALIMEDDIDWDVRLNSQLRTFASASKTWLREAKSGKGEVKLSEQLITIETGTSSKAESTYGDGWDVLWLGHCGADLPHAQNSPTSPLIVTIPNDETVPAPKHLKPHPFALQDKLGDKYPPHTRVVHAVAGNVCTLAYAVSREGARRLLSEFSSRYDAQWDLMLQKWCEGGYYVTEEGDATLDNSISSQDTPPICLTVQPPLFSHYYPKEGGASNIQGQGGGYAKVTGSPYIRLSVRENMRRLVDGLSLDEMVDQLPDDGDPIWK